MFTYLLRVYDFLDMGTLKYTRYIDLKLFLNYIIYLRHLQTEIIKHSSVFVQNKTT